MNKVCPVIEGFATFVLLMVLALLTSASAVAQSVTVRSSLMEDSTGLVYIGCEIRGEDLQAALEQLKAHLGEAQFQRFRAGQSQRDGDAFHVTLINPFELKDLGAKSPYIGLPFTFELQGLGSAANQSARTFYVVAKSAKAAAFRAKRGLKKVDFHATLGFSPEDVFGVSKGADTLLSNTSPP
mgnify:CR=1 FL=1